MGLAEKRAAQDYQNNVFAPWLKLLRDKVGFDLEIEVRWDEIAVAGYGDRYTKYFPKAYFNPLMDALTAVAMDDMGRTALKESLKKVLIKNENPSSSSRLCATFDGGTLTVNYNPTTNPDDEVTRTSTIKKLIEGAL